MEKSSLFNEIEDIDFALKDPDAITEEVISAYELYSGRTLARSDPVRLFLDGVILNIIQMRNALDYAAKMNLLAYASGTYLDHLGAMLGVMRLGAAPASCMMKFTLSAPQTDDITIEAGTKITPDGKIFFATSQDMTIAAGETEGYIQAQCTESGIIGNWYSAGKISRLVDVFAYEMTAENITVSSGGLDAEDDEAFRERIHIAPESFTNAGSIEGYKYYALSADSNIQAVNVAGPPDTEPGHINIYVLMKGGAVPDNEVISKVLASCSAEDVRPDTDYVHVLPPEQVSYNVNVQYWIDEADSANITEIQQLVNQAVNDWVQWQNNDLGRDINPSKLSYEIIAAGAKRCEIIEPVFRMLEKSQSAALNTLTLDFKGLE